MTAGYEHYVRAGEMLIEAKQQVADGRWSAWLKENFSLSRATAYNHMRWARLQDDNGRGATGMPTSFRQMEGRTESDREERQSKQQQNFRRVLREVARDSAPAQPPDLKRECREQHRQGRRDHRCVSSSTSASGSASICSGGGPTAASIWPVLG
jgi:Protein of unknown function (DUF3102)